MVYDGNYVIRSALSNNIYLNIPVGEDYRFSFDSFPLLGRVLSQEAGETKPPLWNITTAQFGDVTSKVHTVSAEDNPVKAAGDDLRLYPGRVRHSYADTVSIELAGPKFPNSVRFHVPNVDSVWTLANDGNATTTVGSPVTLKRDEGLPGQRWTIEPLVPLGPLGPLVSLTSELGPLVSLTSEPLGSLD